MSASRLPAPPGQAGRQAGRQAFRIKQAGATCSLATARRVFKHPSCVPQANAAPHARQPPRHRPRPARARRRRIPHAALALALPAAPAPPAGLPLGPRAAHPARAAVLAGPAARVARGEGRRRRRAAQPGGAAAAAGRARHGRRQPAGGGAGAAGRRQGAARGRRGARGRMAGRPGEVLVLRPRSDDASGHCPAPASRT